jgi:hypothetical protein
MRCRHCPAAALAEKSIRESTKSSSYWKQTPCGKISERVVVRKLEGTALEYLIHDPVEHFDMAAGDDLPESRDTKTVPPAMAQPEPVRNGSSNDPPAAATTTTARRSMLDDSDADAIEEDYHNEDDFAAPPPPKRTRLTKKTPEEAIGHKIYAKKRKFDYADVREATESCRKISRDDFRSFAEKESRASKPRQVDQTLIEEQGEMIENDVKGGWSKIHPSHVRSLVHNVVFCIKCGAWMSSNCRTLGKPCMKVPPYKQAKGQLRRLLRGQYPWKHLDWPDGTPGSTVFKPVRLDNFD